MGTLYYGDNLDILKRYIKDESVDLVYLDPPFNSAQNYNAFFQEKDGTAAASQIRAFEDTWTWNQESQRVYEELILQPGKVSEVMQAFRTFLGTNDMMAYLAMMSPRLIELQRVLKSTGSLYLHCDPTASHYLKLLCDAIMGKDNFRNEIIWRRTNAHNSTTKQLGPIHDIILFYSKTDEFKFHPPTRPYSKAYIEDRFKHIDTNGRYQTNYLTGPEIRHGESGKLWRGFNPTAVGRHWAIPKSLRKFLPNEGKGMSSHEQLEVLYEKGFIVFPQKEGGQPMYKQYVGPGVFVQDIWAYQPNTHGVLFNSEECIDEDVKYLEDEQERLGYPTQKPVGLLERILNIGSDIGDVVLDPFCGCGTTIDAAEKLDRKWIGIDVTQLATSLIKSRLRDTYGSKLEIITVGEPTTPNEAATLAEEDKYQFQWWALGLVGASALILNCFFAAGLADCFAPFCLAHLAFCAAAIFALADRLMVRFALTALAGSVPPPPINLASWFCSSST